MKYSPIRDDFGNPLLTLREAAYGNWGMAICFFLYGWNLWRTPPTQPFTGRLAWFYSFVTDTLGMHGPAIATWMFAAFFAIIGVTAWMKGGKSGS